MSWPVRSAVLAWASPTLAANTSTVIGTVPTGKVWLLKHWVIYNNGATQSFYLQGNDGTQIILDMTGSVGSGLSFGRQGMSIVLLAAATLRIQSTSGGNITIGCWGAQLG